MFDKKQATAMASFRKFTARDKQNALECNGWLSLNVNYRGCLQKYCLRFITHYVVYYPWIVPLIPGIQGENYMHPLMIEHVWQSKSWRVRPLSNIVYRSAWSHQFGPCLLAELRPKCAAGCQNCSYWWDSCNYAILQYSLHTLHKICVIPYSCLHL